MSNSPDIPFSAIAATAIDAIIVLDEQQRIVFWNSAAEKIFRCPAAQALGAPLDRFIPPRVRDTHREHIRRFAAEGVTARPMGVSFEIAGERADGAEFPAEASIMKVAHEGRTFLAVNLRDVTERKQAEALSHGQTEVLQLILQDRPLNDTLAQLVRVIEEQAPGMLGSILLLDAAGACLRHGAAPNLPEGYNRIVEGHAIGPCNGSCGTAAYRRQPVFAVDIATDPLWAPYRGIAESFGLRACWSTPILAADGRLLGTFAMYYREPRRPTPAELRLIDVATRFASIAIERTQTEASLRDSEARYRTLVEQAADGIFIASDAGRFLDVNACGCAMFGYRRDELLQLAVHDTVSAPDVRRLRLMGHKLRDGAAMTSQWTCRRRDGTTFFGEATAKRLPDGRVLGTLRDVTARKQAEDNVRRRAVEFEHLYDTAQTLAGQLDVSSLVASTAQRACQLLNASSSAVLLYDPAAAELELTTVAGRPSATALGTRIKLGEGASGEVARTRQPLVIDDYAAWTGRKSQIIPGGVRALLFVPLLFGGELVGVLVVGDDAPNHRFNHTDVRLLTLFAAPAAAAIHTAKLMEQTHAAEEKYRHIFEDAVEGIFQSTMDGRLLTANPALARMLGYESPQDLLEHVTDVERQLYLDPARRAEFRRLLALSKIVTGFEFELRRRDGRVIWVTENAHATHDASGRLLYYEGTMLDITDRKHLEAQLRQAQKMEALGMLAGGVAHDFNNLLTVINAHSELLLNSGALAADVQPSIQEIQTAGQRAATLTRQLLTFSRKQILRTELIDLNDAIHNVSRMLRRVIGEDIRLDLQLGGPLPPIQADRGMIEQVLVNLAVNARDAMATGGVITIATDLGVREPPASAAKTGATRGAFVRMVFSDTGCGIAPDMMPHIFEPFFTTKEPGKGTGLGLATVFGILQQHRGWIEVASSVGLGTQFTSYWPVNTEPAATHPVESAPLKHANGRETVLLVEDEPSVRSVAAQILSRLGYRVIEAGSGAEALDTWRTHSADISALVTDEVMPGAIRGTELAARLLKEKPHLAVVYTSGYTGRAEHTLTTKRSQFLAKPYTVQSLATALREVLDA